MSPNSKNQKNKPGQKTPGRNMAGQSPAKPEKGKTVKSPQNRNFWSVLDSFFINKLNAVLGVSIVLSVILGAFLFDVKISTGGDDSHYIEMANDFLKGRAFPFVAWPVVFSVPEFAHAFFWRQCDLAESVFLYFHYSAAYSFLLHIQKTCFTHAVYTGNAYHGC